MMADHGALVLVPLPEPVVLENYSTTGSSSSYGEMVLVQLPPVKVLDSYNIAGTLPCPPIPGPPTTGQVWPRGQGWDTTVDSTPEPEPGYGVPDGTTLTTLASGNVWDDGSLPPPPVNTGALE